MSFETAVGALEVTAITIKVSKLLYHLKETAERIDPELDRLREQIDQSIETSRRLQSLACAFQRSLTTKPTALNNYEELTRNLWDLACRLAKRRNELAERFNNLWENVARTHHSFPSNRLEEKWSDVDRARRLMTKEQEIARIQRDFAGLNSELSMVFSAIDVTSNALAHTEILRSIDTIPDRVLQKLQETEARLRATVTALDSTDIKAVDPILSSAQDIMKMSANKYWFVPRTVTHEWIGRKDELERLRKAFFGLRRAATTVNQRRGVIFGFSGSGKTQLACKFAQQHREKFWGVFWIDASNQHTASEKWKEIARAGGCEPNEESGKLWLQNLERPWLLIIDSADHNDADLLESQFPSGDYGCVLITTQNQLFERLGNVAAIRLDQLEEDEAVEMLGKASRSLPWTDPSKRSDAASIAQFLEYLPLAIVHAGHAIFEKYCKLHEYRQYFDKTLQRRNSNPKDKTVWTSFEMHFRSLRKAAQDEVSTGATACQDALELMKMLAFFHRNDISQQTLIRAGEMMQKRRLEDRGLEKALSAGILGTGIRDKVLPFLNVFPRAQPALPSLYGGIDAGSFDDQRVKDAFHELVTRSMLLQSHEEDFYSMHSLLQLWLRHELGRNQTERDFWTQAAVNVLANSINISDTLAREGDEVYFIRILPHVEEVRSADTKSWHTAPQTPNGTAQRSLFPQSWFSGFGQDLHMKRLEAANLARFSRIYHECAQYRPAIDLLRNAENIALTYLGEQDYLCSRIRLLLSMSLWHLGEAVEALQMQESAWNICRRTMHEHDHEALIMLDAMGESCWQTGQYNRAIHCHEAAIKGMQSHGARMFKERVKAEDHLGRVYQGLHDYEAAKLKHERVLKNLSQHYRDSDVDVMIAKDNLATSLTQLGMKDTNPQHFERAHALMQEVFEGRRMSLGKEHPYTLWAVANLARSKALIGHHLNRPHETDEAKRLFAKNIDIAVRNMGDNHIGTLFGRQQFAFVRLLEGNYTGAETELLDIMERQKYNPSAKSGKHPARCETMDMLADCYVYQKRPFDAARAYDDIINEMAVLELDDHPLRKKAMRRKRELD